MLALKEDYNENPRCYSLAVGFSKFMETFRCSTMDQGTLKTSSTIFLSSTIKVLAYHTKHPKVRKYRFVWLA